MSLVGGGGFSVLHISERFLAFRAPFCVLVAVHSVAMGSNSSHSLETFFSFFPPHADGCWLR